MTFGQSSGPPAPARQLAELTRLLEEAGYSSLREARHPYDLTQRQANGKFTRMEASALIERLQTEPVAEPAGSPGPAATPPGARAPRATRSTVSTTDDGGRAARREADQQSELVATLPADLLADELARRGWTCERPE